MIAAFFQPSVVVRVVAETGRPLRAVRVEPEEVRRLHLERRVLRARDAVDERLVRVLLRVVRDRDALVTRERADEDVRVLLLHQAARLLDRLVGRVVRAAVADDLDLLAADRRAVDAVGRLLAGRLGAGGVDQRLVEARTPSARRTSRTRPRSPTGPPTLIVLAAVALGGRALGRWCRRRRRCRRRRSHTRRRGRVRARRRTAPSACVPSLHSSSHETSLDSACCGGPSAPGPAVGRASLLHPVLRSAPRARRDRRARAAR